MRAAGLRAWAGERDILHNKAFSASLPQGRPWPADAFTLASHYNHLSKHFSLCNRVALDAQCLMRCMPFVAAVFSCSWPNQRRGVRGLPHYGWPCMAKLPGRRPAPPPLLSEAQPTCVGHWSSMAWPWLGCEGDQAGLPPSGCGDALHYASLARLLVLGGDRSSSMSG